MTRIKITPEQVEQAGKQFQQASQESQQLVQRLTQTINGMQPEWEGMTQQKFYQEFQTWSSNMRQFVELLNQIGQQLIAIAQRFRATDQG